MDIAMIISIIFAFGMLIGAFVLDGGHVGAGAAQHAVRQRIIRLRRQRIHLLIGRGFRDNQRL